ncbi:diguanylate cyclase [Pseudomonas mosselii]|nr:diguanylate cyclase [Pseudomonas mosselii]
MGAGLPANTGVAGARLRVGHFAGKPAPTEVAPDQWGLRASC